MRILLFGKDGQVGWELHRSLLALADVTAVGRSQCDLTDTRAIRLLIRNVSPDVVVNAAAYTAVDRAESEWELADAVNGGAPAAMAGEAEAMGAGLVHYSTDYVFDGLKISPYREEDIPAPVSAYGRSKLAGELAVRGSGAAHLIFRTSWIFAARGHNFLRTVLRLMRERRELRVVRDQHGTPTWARLVAEVTASVIARAGTSREEIARALKAKGGTFHLTADGATTWFDFAAAIADRTADSKRVLQSLSPITTSEYPTAARRPANSALSAQRLRDTWGVHLPHWTETLDLCLAERPDGVEPRQ